MLEPLSIRKAFSNKRILLTGGSGFIGKVWLTMILDRLPEVGKLYVLLRRNGSDSVRRRFESLVNGSYVFKPLHDKLGPRLGEFLSEKVEVVEGDVTLPGLGLAPETAARLRSELDLFFNCVGLVDFNPDVREAISTNIEGPLLCADFVESCNHAALLHVSTCYVAGNGHGRMPELLGWTKTPNGKPFHAEREHRELKTAVARLLARADTPEFSGELKRKLAKRANGGGTAPAGRETRLLAVLKRKEILDLMIREGASRARERGWPNTYTYTKALAEALLERRQGRIRLSVFRPSIVESSLAYPFPGWNEGFNTSGPLAYLLKSWFRHLPAKIGNPFDVIPVDLVARGMTLAAAALLNGEAADVYQCGTSDRNLFTIDRACELTALGHRVHLRKHGKNALERLILSRWDAKPADLNHHFSISNLKKIVAGVHRFLRAIPGVRQPMIRKYVGKALDNVGRAERKLGQIEEMLELFLPYIHDWHQVFTCRNLSDLPVQEEEFRFAPEKIDWRDYWLRVHMPGLRRWCFPAIEGRERETLRPEFRVHLTRLSPGTQKPEVPAVPRREPRARETVN